MVIRTTDVFGMKYFRTLLGPSLKSSLLIRALTQGWGYLWSSNKLKLALFLYFQEST